MAWGVDQPWTTSTAAVPLGEAWRDVLEWLNGAVLVYR